MKNPAPPLQVFLWVYVFIYAVVCSLTITQVDTWWQLLEGQHILRTGSLPTQPAVAFGLPATPYFDEYAGYEVVTALIYDVSGFIGMWVAFAAMFLLILFLPSATSTRRYPSFDFPSTMALFVATLLVHTRLAQRPELAGVLMQVVLMVILRGSSLTNITPGMLVRLVLVFVAWSNTHDTFIFGFFTMGLWFLNEWWTHAKVLTVATALRRGVLLVVVATVASSLTPYGPRRLLFPFDQAADFGSTALSPEMWPITTFSLPMKCLFAVWVLLLGWGIFTTRKPSPWLIAFAVFSVAITVRNFRFIDFTAIPLLFVYAERNEHAADAPASPPWFVARLRDAGCGLLCVFFLFFDSFTLVSTYNERSNEINPATFGLRYGSDMAVYPVEAEDHRIPVFCGHGMGSYLSFDGHGNFRPMLDSGMSHFSSDTKRYFFFTWNEPEALEAALQQLHVEYVLIEPDTFAWIPTLHRLPDWQFVACSAYGMIWKRVPGGPHPLTAADQVQVTKAMLTFEKKEYFVAAFLYSTLLDRPEDSLRILEPRDAPPVGDPVFNSVSAWVDALPAATAQSFLDGNSFKKSPLLGAILAARIGPDAYDAYIANHKDETDDWYSKAVAIRVLLQKGDVAQARTLFDSITPVPASSTIYYWLWHAVRAQSDPHAEPNDYGQWQTWDEHGKTFMGEMSGRLNDRIDELNRSSTR